MVLMKLIISVDGLLGRGIIGGLSHNRVNVGSRVPGQQKHIHYSTKYNQSHNYTMSNLLMIWL